MDLPIDDLPIDVPPLTPAQAASDAWKELPWPRLEVTYAASRAMRATAGHPRQLQLVTGFFHHLAEHGEPGRG